MSPIPTRLTLCHVSKLFAMSVRNWLARWVGPRFLKRKSEMAIMTIQTFAPHYHTRSCFARKVLHSRLK